MGEPEPREFDSQEEFDAYFDSLLPPNFGEVQDDGTQVGLVDITGFVLEEIEKEWGIKVVFLDKDSRREGSSG